MAAAMMSSVLDYPRAAAAAAAVISPAARPTKLSKK